MHRQYPPPPYHLPFSFPLLFQFPLQTAPLPKRLLNLQPSGANTGAGAAVGVSLRDSRGC